MPIDRVLETYKILLECPVDSIAAQFNIHAIYITYKYICGLGDKVPTLLVTFHTLLTVKTRVSDPFDSNPLANLNRTVDGIFTDGYNLSDTFMATNKGRHRFDRPVAKRSMKICVADTRAVHFHKAFGLSIKLWMTARDRNFERNSLDTIEVGEASHKWEYQ